MSKTIKEQIKYFCAYQERSHREVRNKLFDLKVQEEDIDEMILYLMQENYLNEERYALAYAGGKFRMKQWGKQKIKQGLLRQGISANLIQKALNTIPEDDYQSVLNKLFEKKKLELRSEKNKFVKMTKIRNFLSQRGFGFEDIQSLLSSL
jgi:regulatory protein